jgi:hypothetical protein
MPGLFGSVDTIAAPQGARPPARYLGMRTPAGRLHHRENSMPTTIDHVGQLEKKITELSDALAHLGQGTSQKELLRIIRFPGYTTPAEFTFNLAILNSMQAHVHAIDKLGQDLLAGAKLVIKEKGGAG